LRSDAVACAARTLSDVASGSLCAFGPVSGARGDVLVWGDSHAIALLPIYEQIAMARNVRVHAAVRSACRPLLPTPVANRKALQPACSDFSTAAVGAIDKIDPALVILNAFWSYPDRAIDAARDIGDEGDAQGFEAALDATLQAIGARRKVCVLGDVPHLKYRMPYAYAMATKRGIDPGFIALPSEEADQQLSRANAYFEKLRQRRGLVFVDLKNALCTGSTCALLSPDGRSLYRDDNHLSVAGAESVRRPVESCFDAID
jgi:hypothetical protein